MKTIQSITGILAALIFTTTLSSQNLVPNPGFENFTSPYCGFTYPGEFATYVDDWTTLPASSPDLFHTTGIDSTCWNYQPMSYYTGQIGLKGPQSPRTGEAMAGFFAFTFNELNQRDYLQVKLNTPLTPGTHYAIEYYVSLADYHELSINTLGVYLSETPFTSAQQFNVTPQIVANVFVDDVTNWVKMADTILVQQPYEYLTIGNFSNDLNTSTQPNPSASGGVGTYGAYYFIDDISVKRATVINTTSIDDGNQPVVNVYPTLFTNQLTIDIQNSNETYTAIVHNALGQTIYTEQLNQFPAIIQFDGIAAGSYYMTLQNENHLIWKKLIKK